MEIIDLLPSAPEMPAAQVWEWLKATGNTGQEVIRYTTERLRHPLTGAAEWSAKCSCTACGTEWHEPLAAGGEGGKYKYFLTDDGAKRNGMSMTCPTCGTYAIIAHRRRLDDYPIIYKKYLWEIRKAGGRVMFINWLAVREIGYDYDSLEMFKRNAYVLDPDGRWHRFTAMERGGWSSMCRMEYIDTWRETERFEVVDGNFAYLLPNAPDVYGGTPLENAKLEKLEGLRGRRNTADLLQYARIYLRHPVIENIANTAPKLCACLLESAQTRNGSMSVAGLDWLDWTAKKPHEILRMSKPEYTAAAKLTDPDEIVKLVRHQRAVAICLKYGAPRSYADVLGYDGTYWAENNAKLWLLQKYGIVRTWNYIKKQGSSRLCLDYWTDAVSAGFNLDDDAVVFPRDVKAAQARATAAIKYETKKELREKFKKMAEKISCLRYEKNGLLIIPAENENQLIAEGKFLHHCVGGYGKEHCGGNCIFFIRRADAPDVPFYTLQLDTHTGKVIQNRGEKNCARTAAVRAFENAWLREVVRPWILNKQKATKNFAAPAA